MKEGRGRGWIKFHRWGGAHTPFGEAPPRACFSIPVHGAEVTFHGSARAPFAFPDDVPTFRKIESHKFQKSFISDRQTSRNARQDMGSSQKACGGVACARSQGKLDGSKRRRLSARPGTSLN